MDRPLLASRVVEAIGIMGVPSAAMFLFVASPVTNVLVGVVYGWHWVEARPYLAQLLERQIQPI